MGHKGQTARTHRHSMVINRRSNSLDYHALDDWTGTFQPFYIFVYSAFYIDASVYGLPVIVIIFTFNYSEYSKKRFKLGCKLDDGDSKLEQELCERDVRTKVIASADQKKT